MAGVNVEAAKVRFSYGPGIYSWVAIMFLTVVVVTGVMFALSPNAPPEAQLAGGEVLQRALAGQARAAWIMAAFGGGLIVLLLRFRSVTVDFQGSVIEERRTRAWGISVHRLTFRDLAAVSMGKSTWSPDYNHIWIDVTAKSGRKLRIGPEIVDYGMERLADRIKEAAGL
jgi:hypothetical protein